MRVIITSVHDLINIVMIAIICQRLINNRNIIKKWMTALQTSQVSSLPQQASLLNMLVELDHKLAEISNLKNQITEKVQYSQQVQAINKQHAQKFKYWQTVIVNQVLQLSRYCKKQVIREISDHLQQYNNQRIQETMNIINYYQCEIKKYKNYYEGEIQDLREQIKRQYKVIAMMKQEVEDLMILMKYKEQQDLSDQCYGNSIDKQYCQNGDNSQQRSNSGSKHNKLKLSGLGSRDRSSELDVIEQQTERTVYSSQRSFGNQQQQNESLNPFIKIEDQQVQPRKLQFKDKDNEDDLSLESSKSQNNFPKQIIEHFQSEEMNKYRRRQASVNEQLVCQKGIAREADDGVQCLHSCNTEPTLHIDYGRMHEESGEYKKNTAVVEQVKGQPMANKKYKIRSASANSSKVDHLQSIFYLDDQCESLNKTEKLSNFYNSSENYQEDKNYNIKLIQENHSLQVGQIKHNIVQQAQEKAFHKKKQSTYDYQQQNFINQQSYQQVQHKTKNKLQTSYSNIIKPYKQMSEQETNDFILRKFNKVINIGQFQTSASMPVSTKNDIINSASSTTNNQHTSHRNMVDSKPKTKQFLQQFRKTFNKCLSSLQTSKKNSSSKTLNSSNSKHNNKQYTSHLHSEIQCLHGSNGTILFNQSNSQSLLNYRQDSRGKQNIEFIQKQKDCYRQNKQNSMKAVVNMLKQLQNNNKFVTGGKKIELKYQGDKRNGIRHGNGILYYSNGLCYDGQFKDGLRHGYGTLKFNHIEIYNGDWVNDQIEGEGRIRNCAIINKRKTTSSSAHGPLGKWISYSGQFRNSKFEGQGTLHLQGGEKFVGTFISGYANGEGSICKKNGDLEHGIWQNSVMVARHGDK